MLRAFGVRSHDLASVEKLVPVLVPVVAPSCGKTLAQRRLWFGGEGRNRSIPPCYSHNKTAFFLGIKRNRIYADLCGGNRLVTVLVTVKRAARIDCCAQP